MRTVAVKLGIATEIIEAPSTDGLYENSPTDEEQMGVSYDEIEWAMQEKEAGKILDPTWSDRHQYVWKTVEERYRANQHKMEPIPICKIPIELKQ